MSSREETGQCGWSEAKWS